MKHQPWNIWITCVLMGISTLTSESVSGVEEDVLYRELAPRAYQVEIVVHWDHRATWSTEHRETVEAQLSQSLSRSVGTSWEVQLTHQEILPISRLDVLQGWNPALTYQVGGKLILVVIEQSSSGLRLAVKEGDRTTGEWGLVRSVEIAHESRLVSALQQLVAEAFRPLYQITEISYNTISLIAIAGEWTVPDPAFSCFRDRGLARPIIIYRDRDDRIVKRQILPLTYLSLESRDRGRVSSRLISAFPGPLGSGRKKRVELWALGGQPLDRPADVQLVLQGASQRVLMGHRVMIQSKRYLKEEATNEPLELLSDRFGRVSISSTENERLIWVYVWSGDALLARIPFVPGWSESERLPLPDDTDRLRVEGELDRLRADLITDVSRRAISRIQILRRAKTGDGDGVSRLLVEHGRLNDRGDYRARLDLIETGGTKAAEAAGNRVAAARIRKACAEMSKVINRFLDPDREAEFREEAKTLLTLP